jgi:alpha-N-arabinofuranosidase
MRTKLLSLSLFLCLCLCSSLVYAQKSAPKLVLQLDKSTASVSPTLYGLMTEEINYSYEGGLYAQLVRNPSFKDIVRPNRKGWFFPPSMQGAKPAFWTLTDTIGASISIETSNGINAANQNSLCLRIKDDGKNIGMINEGYWGFPVRPLTKYHGGLFVKTSNPNSLMTVSLISADGKQVYASTKIEGLTQTWVKHEFDLSTEAGITSSSDVRLLISFGDAGEYWLSRVTLFPPTYKNRPNGLRSDIMTMMSKMSPKFLRFPGGNYVEGNTFADRFNWKATIGNPDERAGHNSPWGYRSSDGLGLLEYLEWIDDLGGQPVLAVFAGYTLNGDHLVGNYLRPFVQDALDEIEYVTGSAETKWGAQRVKDGHPSPFPLKYIEIGNEDFFDGTGSYASRYQMFYDAIKAKYPQLQIISTIDANFMGKMMQTPGVKLDIVDEHYYRSAADMYRNAHQYDSYDRKGPKIFCGEWATREGKPTTNMNAALGDAAWMTCMERNSDIVIMSCYAPLFVKVNPGGMQWESDLIGYNTLVSYGSPSYYAQMMFGNYLGDKIIPIASSDIPMFDTPLSKHESEMKMKSSKVPELYYVATRDTKTGTVYLKVVNVVGKVQTISIDVEGVEKVISKATKIELKASNPDDTNTISEPRNIVPVISKTKVSKSFSHTFAPYSITVLQLATK